MYLSLIEIVMYCSSSSESDCSCVTVHVSYFVPLLHYLSEISVNFVFCFYVTLVLQLHDIGILFFIFLLLQLFSYLTLIHLHLQTEPGLSYWLSSPCWRCIKIAQEVTSLGIAHCSD